MPAGIGVIAYRGADVDVRNNRDGCLFMKKADGFGKRGGHCAAGADAERGTMIEILMICNICMNDLTFAMSARWEVRTGCT